MKENIETMFDALDTAMLELINLRKSFEATEPLERVTKDLDNYHDLVVGLHAVLSKFGPDAYSKDLPTGEYAEGMMEGTRQVCLYVSDLLEHYSFMPPYADKSNESKEDADVAH